MQPSFKFNASSNLVKCHVIVLKKDISFTLQYVTSFFRPATFWATNKVKFTENIYRQFFKNASTTLQCFVSICFLAHLNIPIKSPPFCLKFACYYCYHLIFLFLDLTNLQKVFQILQYMISCWTFQTHKKLTLKVFFKHMLTKLQTTLKRKTKNVAGYVFILLYIVIIQRVSTLLQFYC